MVYMQGGQNLLFGGALAHKNQGGLHYCWDANSLAALFEAPTNLAVSEMPSNLYNIRARGTQYLARQTLNLRGFSIEIEYPNIKSRAALLYHLQFMFNVHDDRILILSDGMDFQSFDEATEKWSLTKCDKRVIGGEKYKYVLEWEPFATELKCCAIIEWGELPPIGQVKARDGVGFDIG
jgi:hypothetical protein